MKGIPPIKQQSVVEYLRAIFHILFSLWNVIPFNPFFRAMPGF